jgi:SAM-dependent methyltransferase
MERKEAFDKVAAEYDRIRPNYPIQVFEDIIEYSGIGYDDNILEIGCGTGQATSGFVELGYRNIDAVELGQALAAIAAEKFKDYEKVKIHNASFEQWEGTKKNYDLAISATAFHWIDPKVGYPKVSALLKDNAPIGFFWTHHVPGKGEIYDEISKCYQKHAPHLDYNNTNQVEDIIKERISLTTETGLFEDLVVKRYEWFERYTSDDFISLFNTNSAHQVLEKSIRDNLFKDIKEVIERHGNEILKPQFVVLYLARKAIVK